MNRRIATMIAAAALVLSATGSLQADEIRFETGRFDRIKMETAKGKERVAIYFGSKDADDETILESGLTSSGAGIYTTPHGTVFTLKKLAQPAINDTNRGINSGDWKLTISGSGAEFERLKSKLTARAVEGDTPLVYFGVTAQ